MQQSRRWVENYAERRKKSATAVNKRVAAFEMEHAPVKATHLKLEKTATLSEADDNRTSTNLQDAQVRLVGAEQEGRLARKDLGKV